MEHKGTEVTRAALVTIMDEHLGSILHRDGTVTYWSVYDQRWIKRGESISRDDLAAMNREERERVRKHLGMD